ncbi:hypothetical protein [Actinocorallia sp. A-T 12471]|uniref:hypothetical protein n=1 Tax=Actinocorallia sp. A-T 12471 TaxID=3089813 RepID=UPI0029CF3FB0|nr:hypothetical protein [Actinocorallia sp. A-T 12471]MDX6744588.1 hypothetical protein [Actinocorallia sp. A-T 12471]
MSGLTPTPEPAWDGPVALCCSFDTDDHDVMAVLLGDWLGVPLSPKLHHAWEISYDAPGIEIYAYNAVFLSAPVFLMNGSTDLGLRDAHTLMHSLHRRALAHGIGHFIEYTRDTDPPDDVHILTALEDFTP